MRQCASYVSRGIGYRVFSEIGSRGRRKQTAQVVEKLLLQEGEWSILVGVCLCSAISLSVETVLVGGWARI